MNQTKSTMKTKRVTNERAPEMSLSVGAAVNDFVPAHERLELRNP